MCYYMSSATFWDFAAIAAIDASADIAAIAASLGEILGLDLGCQNASQSHQALFK